MARINIEDSIKSDIRFINLTIKLGSMKLALGELTWAWMIAQKHYLKKDSDRCIPLKDWQNQECSDMLIEVGLAEIKEKGIWIKGSDDQFRWLAQRQDAGSKGGNVTADKKSQKTPSDRQATDQRPLDLDHEKAAVVQPLYSLLSSLSLSSNSSSNSLKVTKPKKKAEATDEKKVLNKQIWESYKDSYVQRYKTEPVRNASVNAKISQLAERLGSEAPEVVKFYLKHNKSHYVSRLHEIGLCLSDAEALRTQWFHNKAITERDVKSFTESANMNELNEALKKGGF